MKLKGNSTLIVVIALVLVVTISALVAMYFISRSGSRAPGPLPAGQDNTTDSYTPITIKPSDNTKVETLTFTKENGQNVKVMVQVPSNWTMSSTPKTVNGSIYTNCADYTLTDADKLLKVMILPLCEEWTPKYLGLPSNFVVVEEEQDLEGKILTTIRYTAGGKNRFVYTDKYKESTNQTLNAKLLNYGGGYMPVVVAVEAPQSSQGKEMLYFGELVDPIVASMVAKLE